MIHDAIVHKITRRNPFLQDWPYYGIIDILNPTTTAQYQHNVTIPTKPGMMHDFRDLRFFQADGTEMPFWNESQTAGSTSFNWIKPYSPSQRKAYVFYGNREATSQSNGNNVFELFDDFAGPLDTTKWNLLGGTPSFANSITTLTSGAAILSKTYFGTGYIMRTRCYHGYNGGSGNYQSQNFCSQPYLDFGNGGTSLYQMMTYNGTNSTVIDLGGAGTFSNYYYWEFCRTGSSNILKYSSTSGGTKTTLGTQTLYVDSTSRQCYFGTIGSGFLYLDFVGVRKYAATEPVCQLNQSGLRNPIYR